MRLWRATSNIHRVNDAQTVLGVEIGGTKLQIVAGDGSGTIRHRWRATADRAGGASAISRQIVAGIHELTRHMPAHAIGVGFGGPVDHSAGRIRVSHQVDGWADVDLRTFLAEQTKLPVRIENDSNLAALAEARRGAGAGLMRVFYFNLGSGVGGGFVTDGKLYHGRPPGEAEFGHLRLERSGTTVESRCSGWAVDAEIRKLKTTAPESALERMIGDKPGGESSHLAAALSQKDASAKAILQRLADDLAFALSHVVHLLNPDVIVLGGGLANIGEPLRAAVAQSLEHSIMTVMRPAPPVRLAKLGEDAVPTGALLLARTIELN
jgi:glucokinase